MQIRTVTVFDTLAHPRDDVPVARAARLASDVKSALEAAGHDVQTLRLALPPFARTTGVDGGAVMTLAQHLEAACAVHGIDYATIGAAGPHDPPQVYDAIPDALGATSRVFACALITDEADRVILPALACAARVIHRLAQLTPDGFGNLRFAALANVPPGAPFLPAAYHDDQGPAIAIGLEAAALAVQACEEARSLEDARTGLVRLIERETAHILDIVGRSCPPRVRITGIDCSLAPFPGAGRSLGTALEALTGGRVGERGTLAAVAWLADALDRATYRRTGYSGVFLPVFEDAVLAARTAEGTVTVSDLLLWSSVCGTGLDTVPLPGDIAVEALSAILLDVAALALRLDKPLSARLMPIPGKRAGDEVVFDFPYFAPSRVLAPGAVGIGGLFGGAETLTLKPHRR